MKLRRVVLGLALGVLAVTVSTNARGADHSDGSAALVQPDQSSDIADLFAWMTADASKMNLVMDVSPNATTTSKFSDAVKYVFHTSSSAQFPTPGTATADVICTFDTAQTISCWVVQDGTTTVDFVTGDASATTGLTSASGAIKVFAGVRDDPFFFNLAGFKNTASVVATAIRTAAASLGIDAAGCPTTAPAAALATLLTQDCSGAAPGVDFFAPADPANANAACSADHPNQPLSGNILSIALQIDKTLLTKGGPVVSTWASTNK